MEDHNSADYPAFDFSRHQLFESERTRRVGLRESTPIQGVEADSRSIFGENEQNKEPPPVQLTERGEK